MTASIVRFEPRGPAGRGLARWPDMAAAELESGAPVQNGHYYVNDAEDHPHALEDGKYQRVLYFSEEENAQIKKNPKLAKRHAGHTTTRLHAGDRYLIHRDEHHLVETGYVNAAPPLDRLDGIPAAPTIANGLTKTISSEALPLSADPFEFESERP